MKKLLSIAVCASAVSAFATDVTVGTVGVTKIHSTLTNTVVAVSYADLASDGEITVSNIVKTTNLTAGDRLHIFTGSSEYQTYVLTAAPGDSHLYWEKTTTWGINSSGEFYNKGGTAASDSTLAAGVGFWLVRNTAPGGWTGGAFDFYTYGKPTTAAATATSGSTKLIGNPLDGPARPVVTGMTNGDRLIIPDDTAKGGVEEYKYANTSKKTGWWHWVSGTRTFVDNLPTIPAGTGCWYATSGNATITWSLVTP